MNENRELVVALSGGRWFVGEVDTPVVNDWRLHGDVPLVMFSAREMFVATRPVVNQETGSMGIRRMSGAVPIAPADKPTTVCILADALMRGSECQSELESMLNDALANETEARSGLTVVHAVPKGGMQ
jgi:hypothetical protein